MRHYASVVASTHLALQQTKSVQQEPPSTWLIQQCHLCRVACPLHALTYTYNCLLKFFHTAPDLFAILKTTEKLERAYVRDAICAKDYEPACEKLIAQFKTLWDSLRDTVRINSHTADLYSAAQQRLICDAAYSRALLGHQQKAQLQAACPATVQLATILAAFRHS